MITLNGFDFDYIEEFSLDDYKDYGYVDFYKNNDCLIRVIVDDFEIDTEYDSNPKDFNPNTGNVRYNYYSYDDVSNIDVYTELIDTDENSYTKEQFLESNPELNGLDLIIEQAENFTKKLFRQWWERQ